MAQHSLSLGAANGSRIGVALMSDTLGFDAGTERQVAETARRLDPAKFDVHVCCLEPSPQLDSLKSVCSTAIFPTAKFNSVQGIRQGLQMRQYFDRHGIQIVHAYMNKSAMFAVFSSVFSDRIVVTSRLNTGYWYTLGGKVKFNFLNLATSRVMANSEEAKRIAVSAELLLRPEMVDVVYQGVDMKTFCPGLGNPSVCDDLGIPRNARVVGIVANLRPVKDLPLFLRAAAIVAETFDDVVFLIVGKGELYQELLTLSHDLGLHGRVFFTQGKGKVMDYLSRMSVGCLTSISEGFSNSILEYMAAGLPVVATAVGGNLEAIVDGATGCLVHKRTPEAFAAPLIALLRDPETARAMGKRGFQRCTERFELGITIRSLEDFYHSLLAARK